MNNEINRNKNKDRKKSIGQELIKIKEDKDWWNEEDKIMERRSRR